MQSHSATPSKHVTWSKNGKLKVSIV